MVPPGLTRFESDFKDLRLVLQALVELLLEVSRHLASGFRRQEPEPETGASITTQSKGPAALKRACPCTDDHLAGW